MHNEVEQTGGIVLKGRNEVKPSEITLGYLVNDLNVVEPIKKHDYDLNINSLKLNSLKFIEETDSLKNLFKTEKVFTIDRLYNLKLIDLSLVGIGLAPEEMDDSEKESSRYRYLSELTKCANKAISSEKEKENAYLSVWKKQYDLNIEKFDKVQCKNKIGLGELYLLRNKLKRIIKKIDKKICTNNDYDITAMIHISHDFLQSQLFIYDNSIIPSVKSNESLFAKLGMPCSEKSHRRSNLINDLILELDCYRYVFKAYLFFLTNDLKQFKQKKKKKASDVFLIDSRELKGEAFNKIDDSNYEELQKYNLLALYDWYRDSIIGIINRIIDADIKRRQVADALVQYTPSIGSIIVFIVSLCLSFTYTFTLLKEMWERHNLMILYAIILGCAIISGINLYRNTKEFKKRPKRKKFSIASLCSFALISIVFFSLNLYYINRYDGYDNTYYYVYDGSNIKIDGLRDDDNYNYELPNSIDGYQISTISDKVFKGNKQIRVLDLSKSNLQLDEACFSGCVNLEKVILPDTLTVIPQNAFKDCEKLKDVESKFGIKEVGKFAFSGCKSLTNINFANIQKLGNNAFENCVSLKSITFNNSLSEISDYAFKNCKGLTFASLPSGLVKIGKEAFCSCHAIKNLSLNNSIQTIGQNAFEDCPNIFTLEIGNLNSIQNQTLSNVFSSLTNVASMVIGESSIIPNEFLSLCPNIVSFETKSPISSIGTNAFRNCSKLTDCKILGTITSLGSGAFSNCNNLSNLDFEKLNVTNIEIDTFNNCKKLSSFTVPETVKDIKDRAFYGCIGLSEFEIPATVIKLGQDVFSGCSNLTSLTIPYVNENNKLSTICGSSVVKNLKTVHFLNAEKIPQYYFEDCSNMSQLILDKSIVEIGDYAFKQCSLLNDFSFVSSAKVIGVGAFYGCSKLTSVSLSNNITKVPDYAFYYCSNLSNLNLSNSIIEIGEYSYNGCSKLSAISFGANIKKIGTGAFNNCNISSVTIPLLNNALKDFLGEKIISNLENVSVNVVDSSNIPDHYFEDCTKLNQITINGDIISIGSYAFSNCYALKDYNISNKVVSVGDYAFNNCTGLTSITVPSSVKQIGKEVFKGCTSINTFAAPIANTTSFANYFTNADIYKLNSLTFIDTKTIPNNYFENYTNLKQFNFEDYESIGNYAFSNTGFKSLSIPVNVKNIGEGAFEGCLNLTDVTIQTNITSLPSTLCKNCKNLRKVNLSQYITTIGSEAFSNCISLENVSNWEQIQKINNSAFENCRSLNSVSIDNITELGSNALFGCTLSSELNLSNKEAFDNNSLNGVIGVSKVVVSQDGGSNLQPISFYFGSTSSGLKQVEVRNAITINKDYLANCTSLQKISIDGDIQCIDSYAFTGLTALKDVVLPNSIIEIGSYAFEGCLSLSEIVLPENLETIGEFAFYNTSLKNVSLVDNIKFIGNKAFNAETEIENIDEEHQPLISNWDKNWNGRRPVNFKTVSEDIIDWVKNNYVLLIVAVSVVIVLVGALIIFIKIRKRKKD